LEVRAGVLVMGASSWLWSWLGDFRDSEGHVMLAIQGSC
jgi:hypothetical protein